MPRLLRTCRDALIPAWRQQPGIIHVELYQSITGDHYVSSFLWENDEARQKGTTAMIEAFSEFYAEVIPYERNAPEIFVVIDPPPS
jgi:heme-degrading monooxygenase HmoA